MLSGVAIYGLPVVCPKALRNHGATCIEFVFHEGGQRLILMGEPLVKIETIACHDLFAKPMVFAIEKKT